MNKIITLLSIIVLFRLTVFAVNIDSKAGTTGISFLKIGIGARAVAMGEAFVGINGDVNCLYWNPAGVVDLQNEELTFTYNMWLEGIKYSFLGFVYPLSFCSVGISMSYLDTGEIQGYDENNVSTGKFTASDLAVGVSYAQKFNNRFLGGGTFKLIQEKLEKEAKTTFTADIGILFLLSEDITFGAAIKNFGPGIKYIKDTAISPLNFKFGCGVRLLERKLTIAIDINKPIDYNFKVNFGIEYLLKGIIAFRGGYKYQFGSNDVYGKSANVSVGVGFIYFPVTVDYAFVPYGDLEHSHRISLNIKF